MSSKEHEVAKEADSLYEGRDKYCMEIDRMVSEGLGGGTVSKDNGKIDDTTTDSMMEIDTILNSQQR
ncbi:hypothetical protein NV379_13035 [Paenibacillus sp. N1-5-1-14]|uniref:hypothetical protein n=1 Tax=Paenibacillus radicibacter TaxID=2972488 RepID=UPI002159A8AD|nr:hypothetical protein [Paenibacillus radicibacter]MCR8643579.1 hypothetical protein [Paenibacillus radicibacter]